MTTKGQSLERLIEREREAIARVLEPTAWFNRDRGTENRFTDGRIERSLRQAKAIQDAATPYHLLPPDVVDVLTEAQQALEGVVALDEEDEGPDGESHSCAFTAARIKLLLAKDAKARTLLLLQGTLQ